MNSMKFNKKAHIKIDTDYDHLMNTFHSTPTALWLEKFNDIQVQKPANNEDNIERGNQEPKILDSIWKLLKWSLTHHSKVTVLRYDFYPSESGINASELHQNLLRKLKLVRTAKPNTFVNSGKSGETAFRDIKYLCVTEKGNHSSNKGIHYHCFVVFRTVAGRTVKQVQDKYRERVQASLVNLLELKMKEAQGDKNSKRKVEKLKRYLDTISKNNSSDIEVPYVKVNGFFLLKRDCLSKKSRLEQKADIEDALAKDKGYRYLRINIIRDRIHNKSVPVGGVLDECIYALSYLSKVVTKEHLPKGTKKFTNSLIPKILEADKKPEVESAFS